jgi:hypothetical protein
MMHRIATLRGHPRLVQSAFSLTPSPCILAVPFDVQGKARELYQDFHSSLHETALWTELPKTKSDISGQDSRSLTRSSTNSMTSYTHTRTRSLSSWSLIYEGCYVRVEGQEIILYQT